VFYDQLQLLVPKNDTQSAAKAAAISAAIGLQRTSWLMFLGSEQSSLSFPLLVVVVAWLTCIFISFGLFAPHNHAVIVTLVVCAIAVSAAIFIIMAMYTPFSGVMRISPFPIRDAEPDGDLNAANLPIKSLPSFDEGGPGAAVHA
jgi:hypothetical protein